MVATTKSPALLSDPEPATPFAWRRVVALFTVVCLGEALLLSMLAALRGVNADEGFYLLAGWRVLGGQRPYVDFFFPQMPYLPYVETLTLALTGPSLLAGRAVSVVSGAIVAGMLASVAAQMSGKTRVGVAVALLYAGNSLVLSYLTVAKTYGLANLALVTAFLLVRTRSVGPLSAALAGACAAVAVGTRLPSVAVLLVLLIWSMSRGVRVGLAFAAGAACASFPWLWLAAQDPQGFWFGNVEFHSLRREISGVGPIVMQKATVLAKWTLLPQNYVIWLLALVGLCLRPGQGALAAACAATLAAGYLAATPTYLEYMVQVLPFLLLCAAPAVAVLLERRGLTIAAAAVYVIGLAIARREAPEASVRGAKTRLWQLESVREVAGYLHDRTEPGDRILSWWEGYPLLAERDGFTGVGFWESNAARKLTPDARRRLHLLHGDDIRALVEAREPRVIVYPDGVWNGLGDAVSRHYRPAARFGSVQVFELREHEMDQRFDGTPRGGLTPRATARRAAG